MKIHFYGAARTVTGSQFVVEANGKRLLIDCGMYQGKRSESYERNLKFRFDPREIDAVILTHAHIDHSGNLPNLVRQGYDGPIYATPATCDLADLMLRDSGHIQESDAEYVNKKRARRGEKPIKPLYTIEDAAHVARLLHPKSYGDTFEILPGISARLNDAGHVLGSSSILLVVDENHHEKRLWFSGDIGRRNMHLLRDPFLPEQVDYMVMESTYGDKAHRDPRLAYEEFCQVVGETVKRRGKVIIPAFAVGRTQELVFALNQSVSEGRLPAIPVFVDSPLAVNASDVFRRHPECFDEETRLFIARHNHPALDFKQLTYVRSLEASKALNEREGPFIVIAASGMAETGRILHHLKNGIEDPRNQILIVSWQAPYTLGRRLADRAETVNIFGEEYARRANVSTIGGLSGHAGQDMLAQYAGATRSRLKRMFLVHGEPGPAAALQERLANEGIRNVEYPEVNDVVEL